MIHAYLFVSALCTIAVLFAIAGMWAFCHAARCQRSEVGSPRSDLRSPTSDLCLLPGDIILTHCTSSWLGRLTLTLSGGPCTHEALVYDGQTIIEAIRAIGKLRKVTPAQFVAEQLADVPPTEWAIYRHRDPLTADQVQTIQIFLTEELTWARYSVSELFLQAADDVLAKLLHRPRIGLDVLVFRRLGDIWDNGVICSKAANRPLIKAGLLPEKLQYGSPSDTWAFITAPTVAAQTDSPATRKTATQNSACLAAAMFVDWNRVAQSDHWEWA